MILPGLPSLLLAGKPPVVTQFFETAGDIVAPAPYTSARVSIIGRGARGWSDFDDTVWGGAGAACSQSILAITGGEILIAEFTTSLVRLKRGSTVLVAAENGGVSGFNGGTVYDGYMVGMGGGRAAQGVGDVRYSGGNAFGASLSLGGQGYSAGAAGTTGNGSGPTSGTGPAGARGTGETFVQTSNGEIAVNGAGVGQYTNGQNYGGGGGGTNAVGYPGGAGIIIIEWGK